MVVALAGIHDALEALEGGADCCESVAGGGSLYFWMFLEVGVDTGLPEIGFDGAEAAEAPFVVDKGVDEETLSGVGRAVLFVEFGGELGEILGGFVEHDLGFGVDTVL
jgi:hypothetical protein